MKSKFLLIGVILAISLIWSGTSAAQGNSGQWRGFIAGTQVQMPTGGGLAPLPGPGQEVPFMYGPGGKEALLEAIARAQTPEGKDFLLRFLPPQNTIDAAPPISPPLTASFTGPSWGGIWTPGDPVIAAGQNHVGVMINSQCDFYTKAGVWAGGSILKVFFAPVFDTLTYRDPFDVKIIFDHHNNRWVMLALTYSAALVQSRYLVAVSQTINPLGLWWIWALDVMDPLEMAPLWADYPGLGFDADSGVYITSNQYTYPPGPAFNYAKIRALQKGSLYSGVATWWDYWGMLDADGATTFTIKPAHTFGNPGMEYLANTKWAGGPPPVVNVWNLIPGGVLTNMGAVPIGAHSPPPIPACSDSGLNLFDCRTQDVQYRDEHLYTSFHEEWDWGMGVKAAVRFLKINIPTMFAVIDERYGHPDMHYFFPSIYSSPNSNIVTVFNRCGYGEMGFEFISARYSTRFLTLGDMASRGSLYLKAGQAAYGDWVNPNRWGDYSGIAYDPYQFCTMWIYSMYATNAPKPANWSTWIGSVFTHPEAEQNHFKTWRILPQTFNMTVFVEDQFMSDDLVLDQIEFFSNPVKKDTFEIVDSLEHLTWYRAHGRDTLLEVEYENQFESTTVVIDSVKYLLLPTAKWSSDIPESLDHYKAYRIKDPVAFEAMPVLNDQFDLEYGSPEFIDSLKPIYFLTPALKNMEQPQMFDFITHYVAYEIFPQRFFSIPVNTFDQFGTHVLQVDTSKILLVPTRKLRAEPPPPPNHYKTWRILPQTFDTTVFVQDQFMEDSLRLVGLEFLSNPVTKIVENDTSNIISPNDHLTWYKAFGRDTLIQVGWVNQFQTVPIPIPIDSVKYLLVPTEKEPHAPPENLDHYKCYRIAMDTGWMEINFTLQDQFDPIPEEITAMSTPVYFCAPCQKNDEPMFDTTTHYVAYLISPLHTISESRVTVDQFGDHLIQVLNSEMLLVPSKKWIPPPCYPPNIGCPADETQNQNGVYTTTTQWTANDGNPGDLSVELISVAVQPPLPPGVSAAIVNFIGPAPGPGLGVKATWGTVTYTVADHCQSGGDITLITTNNCPPPNNTATCTFKVSLTNNPPVITQPDTVSAFAGAQVSYTISGTDPDADSILDQASITVIPSCGTYSITRTSGHGTSSGTWQVSWQTAGCSAGTYLIIHDLVDACGDTSYCTTYVRLLPRECDPNDPNQCDTLWAECGNMRVPPGGGLVKVDLTIANDESLMAIVVPLSYSSPLSCDSMPDSENTVAKVFAGSIVPGGWIKGVTIDHTAKTVIVYAIAMTPPTDCLTLGKGHFATLTLFGDSCCTIQLDTTAWTGPTQDHIGFIECNDPSMTLFYPVCRIDTCHIDRNNPPVIDQPDSLEGYVDDQVSYTFSGSDPDGDVIRDSASLSIVPSCGTYSVTRISGQGTSSGTWQVNWQTNGCQDSTTYLVIVDLRDVLGATAYCTTKVHLSQAWPDHKMHYPQLPDPNGWDIVSTMGYEMHPGILTADDFMCMKSGPITGIHFWGSWLYDMQGPIAGFFLSIHENIPGPPSMPGAALWGTGVTDFEVTLEGQGEQGWYDPNTFWWEHPNHSLYYRYDIDSIPEPFYQDSGTIYWLSIMADIGPPGYQGIPVPEPPLWGWKTSRSPHFEDDAVWSPWLPPGYAWQPLEDPRTGITLDMAFVITSTGPSVLCGDVNNDGILGLGDVVYLISYQYKGGPPPVPTLCVGDVNNDDVVGLGDVVYLISYQYKGGSPPDPNCCNPPWK
jgi:hypothetical protein